MLINGWFGSRWNSRGEIKRVTTGEMEWLDICVRFLLLLLLLHSLGICVFQMKQTGINCISRSAICESFILACLKVFLFFVSAILRSTCYANLYFIYLMVSLIAVFIYQILATSVHFYRLWLTNAYVVMVIVKYIL